MAEHGRVRLWVYRNSDAFGRSVVKGPAVNLEDVAKDPALAAKAAEGGAEVAMNQALKAVDQSAVTAMAAHSWLDYMKTGNPVSWWEGAFVLAASKMGGPGALAAVGYAYIKIMAFVSVGHDDYVRQEIQQSGLPSWTD